LINKKWRQEKIGEPFLLESVLEVALKYRRAKTHRMGFLSALIGNASEVDASILEKEFSELLIDGEQIQNAYKLFRDLIVFR
jgi:hypothetical protein